MRRLVRNLLMAGAAVFLLAATQGCSSRGGHSLGYSSSPYGSGYGYGYASAGYGCRRGYGYHRPRFRRSIFHRPYGYRRYRRRPGVSVGFHLD